MTNNDTNWDTAFASAEQSLKDRKYEEAEAILLKALPGLDNTEQRLARTLEKLSEAQWYQDKLDETSKSSEQLLGICKQEGDRDAIVACLGNLAIINHKRHIFKEAEAFYMEAMRETRILLGPNHSYVSKLKSFYAQMLSDSKRESEVQDLGAQPREVSVFDWHTAGVIKMLREKIEKEKKAGDEEPETDQEDTDQITLAINSDESRMVFNSNRFMIKKAMKEGDFEQAEKLWLFNLKLLQAFKLSGQILFTAFERLAEIKYRQGLLPESIDYMKQSHDVKVESLGIDDPSVAESAEHIAKLSYQYGDCKTAEKYLDQVVATYQKLNGKEHPSVVCALHNLATVTHIQKNYKKAETAYKDALEIMNKVLGPGHKESKRLIVSYGKLFAETGRQKEAKELGVTSKGEITGSWRMDGSTAKLSFGHLPALCPKCGFRLETSGRCSKCD